MHPGAVSMRVSSVLRSAEAYLDARCNSEKDDYRVSDWLGWVDKWLTPGRWYDHDYRVLGGDVAENLIQLPELCRSSLRRGHANLLCIYILFIDGTARRRATDWVRRSWTEWQVAGLESYGPTWMTIGLTTVSAKCATDPTNPLDYRVFMWLAEKPSTPWSSRAVPQPSTDLALHRLAMEFEWDPACSMQYGRRLTVDMTIFNVGEVKTR